MAKVVLLPLDKSRVVQINTVAASFVQPATLVHRTSDTPLVADEHNGIHTSGASAAIGVGFGIEGVSPRDRARAQKVVASSADSFSRVQPASFLRRTSDTPIVADEHGDAQRLGASPFGFDMEGSPQHRARVLAPSWVPEAQPAFLRRTSDTPVVADEHRNAYRFGASAFGFGPNDLAVTSVESPQNRARARRAANLEAGRFDSPRCPPAARPPLGSAAMGWAAKDTLAERMQYIGMAEDDYDPRDPQLVQAVPAHEVAAQHRELLNRQITQLERSAESRRRRTDKSILKTYESAARQMRQELYDLDQLMAKKGRRPSCASTQTASSTESDSGEAPWDEKTETSMRGLEDDHEEELTDEDVLSASEALEGVPIAPLQTPRRINFWI